MPYPYHLHTHLPTLVDTPTKWELVVIASVTVDEVIAFRNEMFLEVGYTDVFHETFYHMSKDVITRRPELREAVCGVNCDRYARQLRAAVDDVPATATRSVTSSAGVSQ